MSKFYKLAYCWPGKDNKQAHQFKNYLTHLAVTGFNFDSNGNIAVPNGFKALLPLKQEGVTLLPVLQNQVAGAFNNELLVGILTNGAKRQNLLENCRRLMEEYGLSGIHLNFENYKGEAHLLTKLVYDIRNRLGNGTEISMALPAKTKITTWFNGYDYQQLAQVNDWTLLMTYDLHWPGGPAGPVGSLGWMEQVMNFAMSKGWRKNQLVLGIPLYGYDWPENSRGKAILHHQVAAIQSQQGIKGQWHPKYGESTFTYQTGEKVHQVWYQDAQAVAAKVNLAGKLGLAGVGFWRLGFEFPGVWQTLARV